MKKKIIIPIFTIVLSTILLATCDSGGGDDGSAGNLIFGLILLLCWLKGGK